MTSRLARWLADTDPGKPPVVRALEDVFLLETPLGSNRGATIDAYNARWGVPLGSPYCASSLSSWLDDVGYVIPPRKGDPWWAAHGLPRDYGPASTDAWYAWAVRVGRFVDAPRIGFAVLYGTHHDPHHIELIIRLTPLLEAFGANVGIAGGPAREGVAFDNRYLERTSTNILGYVDTYPDPLRSAA
jgi:hypothetical protein